MNEVPIREGVLDPGPADALAGMLGVPAPTEHLPPLWHPIYLLERPKQADLGPDGHALNGFPSPPAPGMKRMFAGGRVTTFVPLELGRHTKKRLSVVRTETKEGRSGPLTFVTTRAEYIQEDMIAVVAEDDIVYRTADSTLASRAEHVPRKTPAGPTLRLEVNETLLFRYSALTYNAHRIHYDHLWAANEGYDGLVIHGPLQALMMAELLRREGVAFRGRTYSFRLVAPMAGVQALTVTPSEGELANGVEIRDAAGSVTAKATIESPTDRTSED